MAEENKTFKMLVEEQKKTTDAIRKLTTDNENASATAQASAEAIAEDTKIHQKSESRVAGGIKADQTRLANIAAKTEEDVADDNQTFLQKSFGKVYDFIKPQGVTAADEETTKDTNSYLKSTFAKFLGKGSLIAGKLGSIGEGLKSKVKGGLEGIFKAIKAGAFVALLLGISKFLQSETFKDIKDKYLPAIRENLNNLGDTLLDFKDKIFEFKDKFLNIIAKIKALYTKFTENFLPKIKEVGKKLLEAFETIKENYPAIKENAEKIWKVLKIIGGGFRIIANVLIGIYDYFWDEDGTFQPLVGLKNIFADIKNGFIAMVTNLKNGFFDEDGNFSISAGLSNITTQLGKIASGFAEVAISLGAMFLLLSPRKFFGTAWAMSKGGGRLFGKLLGVGGKVALGFGKLFLSMTGMGTSLADTGSAMGSKLDVSKKTGVFRKLGGLASKFGGLFKFLGKSRGLAGLIIGAGVGMSSLLTNTKVFSSISSAFSSMFGVLSDFAGTIAKTASKAAAAVAGVAAKAAAKIANILPNKVGSPKPGTPSGLNPSKAGANVGKELSEAALKKSLLKTGLGVAGKAIPVAGAVLGLGLAAWRALKGDFVGATGEFAGVFAPSLAGLPIDLGLAARDIYYDQFGVYPEQEKDLKLAKSRMGQITSFLKKQTPKAEIQPSNSQSSPMEFNNSSGNNRSSNLVPNMAYDYNSDGRVSMGEKRNRSGEAFGQPVMIAPVTNIVTTNSSNQKTFFSKSLTMQDPIISSAIGAM